MDLDMRPIFFDVSDWLCGLSKVTSILIGSNDNGSLGKTKNPPLRN